ncbi:hypothetical protein SRHO_G00109620 [Serrasalmus rhombeus]
MTLSGPGSGSCSSASGLSESRPALPSLSGQASPYSSSLPPDPRKEKDTSHPGATHVWPAVTSAKAFAPTLETPLLAPFDVQLEGRCAWLTWLCLIGGLFSGSAAVDLGQQVAGGRAENEGSVQRAAQVSAINHI